MPNIAPTMRRYPGRRHGFTLVEVLLAVGILGIGMATAAALFAAAITENKSSVNDVVGSIIAQNGIVVGQTVLTTSDVADSNLTILIDPNHTSILPIDSQRYPVGDSGTTRGFVLLGRRINVADPNVSASTRAYQLISIAYRKLSSANTTGLETITGTISGDTITISSGSENICADSPVIDLSTGIYATIRKINGTTVTLDYGMGLSGSRTFYVLVEKNSANVLQDKSPAMAVVVTRTGLRSP